ncbi:LysR family transcriptional regulator [Shewanella goraebulensis]|uniref:LysR family transcriptional regulator n=1 Tax=Shewanella goraebulensis TaxID=3050637 RepID=UPI00254E0E3A|nr:LysR family transcriptional regulator [Shewanella goraebulensis]
MQKQLSRLDYFTLKVLIGLFEFKNGSVVAEKLNSTQPKVSRALSTMREVIHNELFIRQQYGLQPNAMAERLYPLAKNIVSAYDQMADVANTKPEHHRMLHIGAPEQMSTFILKSIEEASEILGISHTVDIHPWVENVEQMIVQGKLDYSISSREFQHESVVNDKLGDVEFWFLVVRKDHPILQGEITLEAILSHRLVFIHNGPTSELNELVSRCCETVDLKANISLITSSLLMAFERVVHSDDVCWAPSVFPFELSKQRDDVELVDMTEFYKEHFKNITNLRHPSHFLQFHETHQNEFTSLLSSIMQDNLKSYQNLYKNLSIDELTKNGNIK